MTSPFFSVIIPLYNKEAYIKSTLLSVLKQSFSDFEIIIVNDGSTDNSLKIATKTLSSFKNKLIISQKNSGLSTSRNNGIKLAKGEIVALLDADDHWDIDFLKSIFILHKKFPKANFYGTDYLELYSNGNQLETKKNIQSHLKGKSFLVDNFFKANLYQNIVCQSSFAFKKSVFEKYKYNETIDYSEDVEFYLKCFTKNTIAYTYKPFATIKLEIPNQITQAGIKNKTIVDLNLYEDLALKNPDLKKYLDIYRYSFGSQYKQIGDFKNFKKITKNIDFKNLNLKQQLLLKSPRFISNLLIKAKKILISKKIRLTSY